MCHAPTPEENNNHLSQLQPNKYNVGAVLMLRQTHYRPVIPCTEHYTKQCGMNVPCHKKEELCVFYWSWPMVLTSRGAVSCLCNCSLTKGSTCWRRNVNVSVCKSSFFCFFSHEIGPDCMSVSTCKGWAVLRADVWFRPQVFGQFHSVHTFTTV